ncbi:DUF1934 domain-containing protein [Liquorilactobacillus cacaonum]|uniref:DUF1934 domain-containing protein n=1 Tax=Liquorilactobacillus cacaonum DSM 21116 TaxID=1423729 RepID=A0A0R2CPZ1_9LACO|nr:DUF1934 domain-containing protein [Liquorilactobacillus cacaonum]KRM92946.1 hypothetical protein FC80_GL000034 [Liquorilactobacillus cacaonum DSM 21116]
MSSGTPVLVDLKTITKQNGETSKYERKFKGQVFQMGNSMYLRYNEDDSQESAIVTFKISFDGGIQLIRKTNDMRMQLFFEDNKRIAAVYRTPYGEIPIETVTPVLNVTIDELPLVGNVAINYFLYSNGELLGEYKIRLQFVG